MMIIGPDSGPAARPPAVEFRARCGGGSFPVRGRAKAVPLAWRSSWYYSLWPSGLPSLPYHVCRSGFGWSRDDCAKGIPTLRSQCRSSRVAARCAGPIGQPDLDDFPILPASEKFVISTLPGGTPGDDAEAPARGLDMGSETGDVHVGAPLQPGDGGVVDVEISATAFRVIARARSSSCSFMASRSSALRVFTRARRSGVKSLVRFQVPRDPRMRVESPAGGGRRGFLALPFVGVVGADESRLGPSGGLGSAAIGARHKPGVAGCVAPVRELSAP